MTRPVDDSRRGLSKPELFITIFVLGASTMVIEIMGTRVIGPVFGVGLFVWSALLSVTLGALAVGYYCGGVLADRTSSSRLIGGLATATGALLALVPLLSHSVLTATEALGPRWGALVSAALLFAPSLVVLGMTGPVAVRRATLDLRLAGRSVGSIYAVSTAGSVVGTLGLAYLVIPAFETQTILLGTAGLLILLGASSLAWRKSPKAFAAMLLPLIGAMVPERPLPNGFSILDRSQSIYGLVEVIEDSNRAVRFLRSDHSIIGAQFVSDGSPAFAFLHVLEAVRFVRPQARNALQIGLGIGSLPRALSTHGIRFDAVEIDPSVARFARQYFGYLPSGQVYEEDARTYLQRTQERYDIVVHDTFTGGTTPEHLLSLEVLQRIHALLRPGGVLALNFIGYHEGEQAEASFAVARTVKAVFANVRVFRDAALTAEPANPGNLLFFASNDDLKFDIPADAEFEGGVCEQILRSFQSWEVLRNVPRGTLITDAKNPLSRLQIRTTDRHFVAMNELMPAEVWLH
ncbi:MAG TPA: fused MFS/spermidine synthase [Polyangiaceae bacterium]|nr:fused MFS/spermidine synthase [Polyangiaceae bacterium]